MTQLLIHWLNGDSAFNSLVEWWLKVNVHFEYFIDNDTVDQLIQYFHQVIHYTYIYIPYVY